MQQQPDRKAYFVDFGGEVSELNSKNKIEAKKEAFRFMRGVESRLYYGPVDTVIDGKYIMPTADSGPFLQLYEINVCKAIFQPQKEPELAMVLVDTAYLFSDDYENYGLDPRYVLAKNGITYHLPDDRFYVMKTECASTPYRYIITARSDIAGIPEKEAHSLAAIMEDYHAAENRAREGDGAVPALYLWNGCRYTKITPQEEKMVSLHPKSKGMKP